MPLNSLKISPRRFVLTLTHCIVAVCVILFVWINVQERTLLKRHGVFAVSIGEVPILQKMMFDYPPDAQALQEFIATHELNQYTDFEDLPPKYQRDLNAIGKIPSWKGIVDLLLEKREGRSVDLSQVTLFHNIRQGEWWRLVTPTLLHYQFLHLLFNMAWLWMLGNQIEHRLGKWKLLLLTLIIALVTNVAQYLMTGPLFLGYSGVVVGMAGFIWMRQRIAPWEGYPLAKATSLFLLIFILAILALEIVALGLQVTHVINTTPNIANTAHIVGGLSGIGLAKIPFFTRKSA
jgi:GlpG protein